MAEQRGVVFYEHENYGGASYGPFGAGDYAWVEDLGIANDQVSSWRTVGIADPKNVTVEVFEHINFGGASRAFPGEVKFIGPAMNDKMSSFRIKIDEAAERKLKLQQAIDKAKQDAELKKYEDELTRIQSGGVDPAAPPGGGTNPYGNLPPAPASTFRTYELFGILNGMNVPLAQVVVCDRNTGRCSVVPGGRVIVGEQPNEGYGLAGAPGRWSTYYAGRSPAEFGLDADKGVLGSDGSRGWVLTAQFLSQVFGMNWRSAIYS
jgi:hypothetical protein